MRGRDRPSGRVLARAVGALFRFYAGLGGPLLAVVLFLGLGDVWWALGSMVPWFLVATTIRRLGRG